MNTRLIIVGGSGFGREVASWAQDCADAGRLPPLTGYLDDRAVEPLGGRYPHLGTISDFAPQPGDQLLLAVGDPATKRKLAEPLRTRGAAFASLIHPTAIIGQNCTHGEGVIICPLAIATVNVRIGSFVTLLSFSGLGHDARAGDYATISTHVDIMGGAELGEAVFMGSGARVMPGKKVGDGARIGAGVVVMRSVKPGATMFGLPAKQLKLIRAAE